MKALALDFDGVICDSSAEVRQTAIDAWSILHKASDLGAKMTADPERRATFSRLVPLGNRAEDFGVALYIIDRELDVQEQDEYDRVRSGLGQMWLDDFHHTFYGSRAKRRETDIKGWLELHNTFPSFMDLLRRRQSDAAIAIVTAKDHESVKLLLEHFATTDLFADELIFDKETGVSKTVHLTRLSERLNIPFPEITFVDDKLNHLEKTAPLGVCGVLASWGENNSKQHKEAQAAGFAVASFENVEDVLYER